MFKKADITNIKCKDERFDKVVAGNVIHLLPEPEKALRELERVVKPGGKTPCLHLLKVDYPINDESTLRYAGCFFFGLVEENFGLIIQDVPF